MAISGLIAGGVQAQLDDVNDRRLKELVRQMQEKQQADALALQTRQVEGMEQDRVANRENQRRTIDLNELKRRDDNNARGLDLMKSDKQAMDVDAAIGALPSHLKPIGGLVKIGALGKLSPEDLEAPEARAARAASAREQAVQDQIRVRNATRVPREPTQKRPEWVRQPDGSVVDINGVAPPGTKPYDAVAERSSKPINNAEVIDTANEAKRLASELKKHKGLPGAFGVLDQYIPTLRQDTQDAVILRDALTGLLTLENMSKMKGVLSDSDMKLLRQASTTLQGGSSERAAMAELDRIVDVMGKVAAAGVGSDDAADLSGVTMRFNPATGKLEPVKK